MEKKKEEPTGKVLKTLRKTRKAFLIEYLCGLFLLGLIGFSYLKEIGLHENVVYFVAALGLVSIGSAEFARLFVWYKFTDEKMVIIKGIIKQKRKNIYYHPLGFVPDLNVKQSRIQRLLNYGTVFLEMGESSFEFKDVNKPHKVLKMVEGLIERHRRV